jgi:hypothetical protein
MQEIEENAERSYQQEEGGRGLEEWETEKRDRERCRKKKRDP